MTETPILDERAVSEIEARYDLAKDAFHPYAETAKSLADIPALCATVKHLRAEIADYETTNLVPRSRYDALNADWLEARQQTTELADRAGKEIESLQSQLEQLRAENELLKIAAADPADKEYGPTVYDSKGNYTVLAQNAIDRNVSELRARAIQLCKDKAAEWQAQYDVDVTGDHDDKVYYARAAKELATELEKL